MHRLHPYLGKFVPQLVEILLERYFRPGQHVLDPFVGSGTTLVQALESGLDSTGVDVAAFNVLLTEVKTRHYDPFRLERELRDVHARLDTLEQVPAAPAPAYLDTWYAPEAALDLMRFRSLLEEFEHADVLRIVLARAARSARRTTHFDLDVPRRPQLEPYWCHKHRRICRPVAASRHFLRRYTLDTLRRIKEFARVRSRTHAAVVLRGDSRVLDLDRPYDGVITSPPYPGLIDYHEQHRYAYELLGLPDERTRELGAAGQGTSRSALEHYVDGIAAVLTRVRARLPPGAPVVIVVHDSRDLYGRILEQAALPLEHRLRRHVNRRTGRRAGEFYEEVLVARVA